MGTRREIILEELDRWRAQGLVDDATHARLASHYDARAMDERLDAPLARAEGREGHAGFGLRALQIVGGLLLGAACVALVVYLKLDRPAASGALVALGLLGIAGGSVALRMGPERSLGMAEAAMAAGLVAMTLSSFFEPGDGSITSILGMLVAVATLLVVEGAGPMVVLATAAFAVAGGHIALGGIFHTTSVTRHALYLVALLAYGALLMRWRGSAWADGAQGMLVAPLALVWKLLLDDWRLDTSTTTELLMGAYLAVFLVAGILLGRRGLVVAAAAGLLIDAVIFAFDVGGALTGLAVLVALGALLVWQAEFLRSYFRRRGRAAP